MASDTDGYVSHARKFAEAYLDRDPAAWESPVLPFRTCGTRERQSEHRCTLALGHGGDHKHEPSGTYWRDPQLRRRRRWRFWR